MIDPCKEIAGRGVPLTRSRVRRFRARLSGD
jgi:hypothetical protein